MKNINTADRFKKLRTLFDNKSKCCSVCSCVAPSFINIRRLCHILDEPSILKLISVYIVPSKVPKIIYAGSKVNPTTK